MKKLFTVLLMSVLSACGGGGGSDNISVTPPPPAVTTSISGSVAGTTIIALNSSGNIVATSDTAGRTPDVDTDGDGGLDAYSFVLNGIPLTDDVRVYLVTGGGIYPMYFDTDNNGTSDSNVFALASGHTGPLALGFIDLNIEDGRAIPANNPASDNDVASKGAIPVIPVGINEPPTSGLTVAELNTNGKNAVASGWVLGAKTYFQAAVDLAANNAGNDTDTARFMLALTRVAALGFDTASDGSPQDMGRLGDLLDLFGFANNEVRANWDLMETPDPLPDASPTGNDIRNFSYDVVRRELQAAITDLDKVSQAFDAEVTVDNEALNADYGDALFFRGLLSSVKANMEIQRAYNLNVDIDDVENNNRTVEDVHTADGTLLGSPDLEKLAEAKASLSIARARLMSAIDSINAETDDQTDDVITLDETVDSVVIAGPGSSAAEVSGVSGLATIKTWIDEAQSSIDGNSTNVGRVAVNLQAFFDDGIVLDDTTLPVINGDDIGDYPDPTFGGVIIDTDTDDPGIQTLNSD
jgi:hypothetical protein